jgi:hypothetical protein
VGLWTTQERCPQAPQAQQQQQKRTNDVLQTADNFTRYGQGPDVFVAAHEPASDVVDGARTRQRIALG